MRPSLALITTAAVLATQAAALPISKGQSAATKQQDHENEDRFGETRRTVSGKDTAMRAAKHKGGDTEIGPDHGSGDTGDNDTTAVRNHDSDLGDSHKVNGRGLPVTVTSGDTSPADADDCCVM